MALHLLAFIAKLAVFLSCTISSLIIIVDLIGPTVGGIAHALFVWVNAYIPLAVFIKYLTAPPEVSVAPDEVEVQETEEAAIEQEEVPETQAKQAANGTIEKSESADAGGKTEAEEAEGEGGEEEGESKGRSLASLPTPVVYVIIGLLAFMVYKYPTSAQFMLLTCGSSIAYVLIFAEEFEGDHLKYAFTYALSLAVCFGILYAPRITLVQMCILGACTFALQQYEAAQDEKPRLTLKKAGALLVVFLACYFGSKKYGMAIFAGVLVLLAIMDRARFEGAFNVTFWLGYCGFCVSIVRFASLALLTTTVVGARATAQIVASDNEMCERIDTILGLFTMPEFQIDVREMLAIVKDTVVQTAVGAAEEGEGEAEEGGGEEAEEGEPGEEDEGAGGEEGEEQEAVEGEEAEGDGGEQEEAEEGGAEEEEADGGEGEEAAEDEEEEPQAETSSAKGSGIEPVTLMEYNEVTTPPPISPRPSVAAVHNKPNTSSAIDRIESELESRLNHLRSLEHEVKRRLERMLQMEKLDRIQKLETEVETKLKKIISIENEIETRRSRRNSEMSTSVHGEDEDVFPTKGTTSSRPTSRAKVVGPTNHHAKLDRQEAQVVDSADETTISESLVVEEKVCETGNTEEPDQNEEEPESEVLELTIKPQPEMHESMHAQWEEQNDEDVEIEDEEE